MPLIKGGEFVADPYAVLDDAVPLPETGGFSVTVARFRKERADILARNAVLGVRLKSDESPELVADDVGRFGMIALEFPRFRDGRAFSWARMLRTRLGFAGEVRGTGHFLYDQLNFMHRTGFDAFEVPKDFPLELYQRALKEMTGVYQPSADRRTTIRDLRDCH
jgi:uncharacterized protein (DUF934 family)